MDIDNLDISLSDDDVLNLYDEFLNAGSDYIANYNSYNYEVTTSGTCYLDSYTTYGDPVVRAITCGNYSIYISCYNNYNSDSYTCGLLENLFSASSGSVYCSRFDLGYMSKIESYYKKVLYTSPIVYVTCTSNGYTFSTNTKSYGYYNMPWK